MSIKTLYRVVKHIFKNLYFLTFLNGFLLASIFYFKMEANYENLLFKGIKISIDRKVDFNDTEDSVAIKIMNSCYTLLDNRSHVFDNDESLDGFQVDFLHPATVDLMTAKGACGSYSMVLARVLQNYHYPVRIGQMKANGVFAAHNIIETRLNNRWVVLDPTFNLYFVRPDNQLAGFEDIKNNWDYYSKQVPANYNHEYKYEDVRYTNWEKIPIVLPAAKRFFGFIFGKERIDTFCMRVHFLKLYEIYFYGMLILYIPVFFMTLRRAIKTKLFPTRDVPLTVTNIIKHFRLRISNAFVKRSINS
jgi:hypothetical protein